MVEHPFLTSIFLQFLYYHTIMLILRPTNQPLSVVFHLQVSYLRHLYSLIINPIYSSHLPIFLIFSPLMLALTSSVIHLLFSCQCSSFSISQPSFAIMRFISDKHFPFLFVQTPFLLCLFLTLSHYPFPFNFYSYCCMVTLYHLFCSCHVWFVLVLYG